MSTPKKYVAPCPYCGFDVWMDEMVDVESIVTCQNCATELAVVSLDPPELDYYWEDVWEEEYESQEDDGAFGADGRGAEWDDSGAEDEVDDDGD
jgi:lysine biosynthesis protein LysW